MATAMPIVIPSSARACGAAAKASALQATASIDRFAFISSLRGRRLPDIGVNLVRLSIARRSRLGCAPRGLFAS
jgi:hypothetical protein